MKAAVYLVPGRHHQGHAEAMAEGLRRHGVEVSFFSSSPDADADFATCWGWRAGKRIKNCGFRKPILVMERGYLGDRFKWTSLGWDGLNGRARFPAAQDSGERFWSNFGHLACEWEQFPGYALLTGQVLGDMALTMVDFPKWLKETVEELERIGWAVRFRPHPEAVKRGQVTQLPAYMHLSEGTLADAMSEAGLVVTFNSNTGCESVLAGIPTVACDEGSMAWGMTSNHVIQNPVTPDRSKWFRDIAWKQWTTDEIASGFAWDIARTAL